MKLTDLFKNPVNAISLGTVFIAAAFALKMLMTAV